MTIEDIRRANIRFWAEKLGRATLAEKLGYKDTIYINQLCAGHGSFGGRTARKIERALSLPEGWFDVSHQVDPQATTRLDQILDEIKDWDDPVLAEIQAQIELIKRRLGGGLP